MEIQLILRAYIVYFGLRSVQPYIQEANQVVTGKVNDESKIRENFQTLFDSIAKNNTKKSVRYHEILKQEVSRERQAFDAVKDTLWTARNRNYLKKTNFGRKSYISEDVAMTKRETNKNDNGLTQSSALRELPSVDDSFESIRTKNKVYVDKSNYITKLLARDNRFIRICRPRRFGKSNFLQMLESFFKGENKSFFADLPIHADPNWQTYPVIYLDFNTMNVNTTEDFQVDLKHTLMRIGSTHGLRLREESSVETQLHELVENLSTQRSQLVVVLVDEYDWPVRRHIENEDGEEAEKSSRILKRFFAQFKTLVQRIKLVFLTCTMRLELEDWRIRDGGLRTLEDITLDPEFSGMIGLTGEELTSNFEPHMKAMTNANQTFHSLLQTLRRKYNGYCFSRNTSSECQIYNFHSVISCLRNQKVGSFWHQTENTNFNAIEDFRKQRYVLNSFINRTITTSYLQSTFDHDNPPPVLFCLLLRGYLTLRSYDEKNDEYVVDFPNEEIREVFVKELMRTVPAAGRLSMEEISEKCKEVRAALSEDKIGNFIKVLNDMVFEPDDVELDVNVNEHEYTERIARLLQTCDITCSHDSNYFLDMTIDLNIEVPDQTQYLFEFSWKKTAGWAMNTLLNISKTDSFQETFGYESVYLIGANFNPERRIIDEWIKMTHSERKCTNFEASHPHYLKMYSYLAKNKICSGLPNE